MRPSQSRMPDGHCATIQSWNLRQILLAILAMGVTIHIYLVVKGTVYKMI